MKTLILLFVVLLSGCPLNYDWVYEIPYFTDFEKLTVYIENKIEYKEDKNKSDEFKKCELTWETKKGDCEDKAKLEMLIWYLQHNEKLEMVLLYWYEDGIKQGHATVKYNDKLYYDIANGAEIVEKCILTFDIVMLTEIR